MSGETVTTIAGNLTEDPELRLTPAGDAVATFTVASSPRILDRQTGVWTDGDTLFLRCTVWRDTADHVTASLTRGDRVVVTGRLKQRSFQTKDGDKRIVIELDVDEVGASLRYTTATPRRDLVRAARPYPG